MVIDENYSHLLPIRHSLIKDSCLECQSCLDKRKLCFFFEKSYNLAENLYYLEVS